MCDSQTAIQAIDNAESRSKLVASTGIALNSLGGDYQIKLNWIKAHVNHLGNEIADRAAKTGCSLPEKESVAISKAYVKSLIRDEMIKEWDRRWQTAGDCRQTFGFFPCVDLTKSKELSHMGRKDLGIMVRYLTGHAHLQRHNKIANTVQPTYCNFPRMKYSLVDPDDGTEEQPDWDVICRLCQLTNTEETPLHLIRECLAAWKTRLELFGCYCLADETPLTWSQKALLQFFKHFDLENKPNSL